MPRLKNTTDKRFTLASPPGYGFADVLALTRASRSNLIHWTNSGLIVPELGGTAGTGHHRRFSAFNVIEVELAAAIAGVMKRVPIETITGGLNAFRRFHLAMAAVHGEVNGLPLPDEPHLRLFDSIEHRRATARGAAVQHVVDAGGEARVKGDAKAQVIDHLKAMAAFWSDVRTSELVKGTPSARWGDHFLALFISGMYADSDATFARVAYNPKNISEYIEESAIVIDLVNMVFRVGQRTHGLGLQRW